MSAALTETRTLKGVVKLAPLDSTKYYFELQQLSGTKLPNSLDNVVLEEVFINVDTSNAGCKIYLPAISTFNLAWNAKIYITWVAGGDYPTIFSYEGTPLPNFTLPDVINGSDSQKIDTLSQTAFLRITEEHNWAFFLTSIPA
jgi:hypothetical protein